MLLLDFYLRNFEHCEELGNCLIQPLHIIVHHEAFVAWWQWLKNSVNNIITLLQDAANATLRSETLRRNCVRCRNRKRWCKKPSKRCKTFAMEDASNAVQNLVACAMQGIRSSSISGLRQGGTKETGSQMKACAIYSIRFTGWTVCDEKEQQKRAARSRCVRYTAYSSLRWTVCDEWGEHKWFGVTRCVWYRENRSVIKIVCNHYRQPIRSFLWICARQGTQFNKPTCGR